VAVIKKVSEAVIFMAIGAALFAANPRVGQGGGVYLFSCTAGFGLQWAEEVYATTLPHPWIGSEQGSPDSHKDHRFRHFLDHSHPSLGYEILACHTAVTAKGTTSSHRVKTPFPLNQSLCLLFLLPQYHHFHPLIQFDEFLLKYLST
jgi:hypothetical protein